MTKEKFEEYVRRHPMATLSSIIYEILYDEIVSGELSPGTKMNTAQLAEEINVSRTPIIDAYEKLKEIRFMETSPTKGGYYVSPLYISDFRDMMIVRKALEKTAAYTMASIHNMEHIKELYEIAEKLQTVLFDDKYYMQRDLENRFHSLIVESSKNSYLIGAYRSISKLLYRHYYYMDHMTADTANLFVTKEAAYDHIAICKALESGLPENAEKAMERHMDAAIIIYLIHAHKWYS